MLRTVVLLSLAIIMTSNVYPQQSIENRAATNAHELKILSWNIYMLPALVSTFNHNSERAELIGDQLKDSDYQIIVFQEAFTRKSREIISRKLSDKYPYQYGPINPPAIPLHTNSGLWIISRIPLTLLKSIKFKRTSGFDSVAQKGAALFQGNYKGSSFQLLATHLQADNPERIAVEQCREIAGLLHEFYQPDMPQLLCGDFNTEMADTPNYKRMLQTLDADNGDLEGKLRFTYDEFNNSLAQKPNGKTKLIDYILTRNTHLIEQIKRSVVEFCHTDNNRNIHLSDHYALEATVSLTIPTKINISEHNILQTASLSH
ncbi:MAG: sphingomyelin phosphodiesterase [Paludibacter sp.]|nr:sphingomyelin phosphodiesterase [Paludibacter sp.]